MDPTARFFKKLRKLTVTLETETTKLQQDFENRNINNEEEDSESTARAMRAYHELNCDVGNLKGQIQGQLAQQKARGNEVSSFIKACRVMEQRVTQDIQTLRGHWEKYGYQAPQDTQKLTKAKSQESEAEDEDDVADGDEATAEGEEEDSQGEAGGDRSTPPSDPGPAPFPDAMRTPQLSDFGLSEMQLKRAIAGAGWCSEVPPMPEMRLPHPSLPPMPLTPKCALRMDDDDDDELQTPQLHDFGISEHTMCLNNDFTMDLFKKNVTKPQRPPSNMPTPPRNSLMESLQTQVNKLESPELPVFCTPGLKIKNASGPCATPARGNTDQESPIHPNILPTTPEAPAFQTPYMNRLISTKKSGRQTEPIRMQEDGDNPSFELPPSPHNGTTGAKRTWNVPEISIVGVEDNLIPEMPNLESLLGNTLQNRSAKMPKKTSEHKAVTEEPSVRSLELDGPTQEFNLGTPRIRMDYQEPSTPEMPDLSSVTQDICKLLSEAQKKKKTVMAVVNPNVRPDKNSLVRRTANISAVSESEFQSLPGYLKQMTLHNLNQAVHSINDYTEECQGEKTEFQMEELRRITNVGTRTPVYILCLTELKRLKQVGGARNTSVYKLCTQN